MTRRNYKKPHRAKKVKPLVAKASFWRAVFGVSAASGLVWLVCFSPALEVKEIKITGTEKVSGQDCVKVIEDEISKKIAMFDSKSILLFNLDQAKNDILARYPQIQNIKIERQFPSKIYASVEERRGIAVFNAGGKSYLVDDGGIGFQEIDSPPDLLAISDSREAEVVMGGQVVSKEVLSGIL
ncbi:MAG: FtsQ-type POTRA domain-containing protein, partial [Candidatus Paceibacterota bacterium]